MNATQTKEASAPQTTHRHPFRLKRILLAHDGSKAAGQALTDATTLASRFKSEILLARIQSPEQFPLNGMALSHSEKSYVQAELKEVEERLVHAGLSCRSIVRLGAVGDTIANLCAENGVDLVMFGAYGCGSQDRHTLGSTAEHLLSALPCPAMVYGPNVRFPLLAEEHDRPVLFAVSFPVTPSQTEKAIQITRCFDVPVEVLHVADTLIPIGRPHLEEECEKLASALKSAGLKTTWSVLSGQAWKVIAKQSTRLASPFVLLPIKYCHIMADDHVAARVIRTSDVPVLTYSVK